ncbi:hypothetical protein BDV95DRAFT_592453 [Massariosphaeria phaeospora]|uniref:Uncharacterized protein n=1 Tax=Massariosphaeria phaeospora TaxID=100035 RepID=A0A7C8MFX2_9PLEO|nr:hypothetical protein BDV95DRAFT_592453 [Massariosphaeria phaeospora]
MSHQTNGEDETTRDITVITSHRSSEPMVPHQLDLSELSPTPAQSDSESDFGGDRGSEIEESSSEDESRGDAATAHLFALPIRTRTTAVLAHMNFNPENHRENEGRGASPFALPIRTRAVTVLPHTDSESETPSGNESRGNLGTTNPWPI